MYMFGLGTNDLTFNRGSRAMYFPEPDFSTA
jgi:hypothetical protein